MKIVMLGHSNAGKSTYMASMYGAMQHGLFGLQLRTQTPGEHDRLISEALDIQKFGDYPPPTAYRTRYDFKLQHANRDAIAFEWSDYAGGNVSQTSTVSADAGALHADIDDADGLLVFCDSTEIASGNFDRTDLGLMISLLANRLARQQQPIWVSILLTKCDLVTEYTAEMIECFEGVIGIINSSPTIEAGFIPVACGLRPANVVVPMCFALTGAVDVINRRQAALADEKRAAQLDAQRKSQGFWGFLDVVVSAVINEPSYFELAQRRASELQSLVAERDRISGVLGALRQTIEPVSRVTTSKRIDDYVAEISVAAASAAARRPGQLVLGGKRSFY